MFFFPVLIKSSAIMKLHFFLLAIATWIPRIQSLATASPSELMYMYSAYKIDYGFNKYEHRTIGIGCVSHKVGEFDNEKNKKFDKEVKDRGWDGICSFGEFAFHIVNGGLNKKFTQLDTMHKLYPTIEDVTKEVINQGIWQEERQAAPAKPPNQPAVTYRAAGYKSIRHIPNHVSSTIEVPADQKKPWPYADVLERVKIVTTNVRKSLSGVPLPLLDAEVQSMKNSLAEIRFHRLGECFVLSFRKH